MILRFGGVIGFSGCVAAEVFIINKYCGALILVFKGGRFVFAENDGFGFSVCLIEMSFSTLG